MNLPVLQKFLFVVVAAGLISGCDKSTIINFDVQNHTLSDSLVNACCAFFTESDKGEPVLVYTAGEKGKESYVYFSTWDDERSEFSMPSKIEVSHGVALNTESMAKIAFKSNGDMVLVYGLKRSFEDNPYASEIRHSFSSDKGTTWTRPQFLHEDTVLGKGRSYFDICRLPDGEVGATWLDASYPEGGRPVMFAKTQGGKTFVNEVIVDSLACECCRTKIITDQRDGIHVAFRDVNVVQKDTHIRDVLISSSYDKGSSFSKARPLSEDKWKLMGCPHSGPGISKSGKMIHAAWFTAGGTPGIYYTATDNIENGFKERELVTKDGKNPQIYSWESEAVAIVWGELPAVETPDTHEGHDHKKMNLDLHKKTTASKIMMRVRERNKTIALQISEEGRNASFPVVTGTQDFIIVSWAEELDGKGRVMYKVLRKNALDQR